ncbi:hypothetical protein CCP2SC5_90020 [Azospirillaceae bacterium]
MAKENKGGLFGWLREALYVPEPHKNIPEQNKLPEEKIQKDEEDLKKIQAKLEKNLIDSPPQPSGASEADLGGWARLESQMSDLIAKGAVAAAIQYLDLEQIKEKVGDRWQEIYDKAQNIATRVIERRLAPDDLFFRDGQDGYVIMFAGLNEEQGRLKSTAIGYEILQTLMGDLGVGDRHWVRSFVSKTKTLDIDDSGSLEQKISSLRVSLNKGENAAASAEFTTALAPPVPAPRLAEMSNILSERKGVAGKTQFLNLNEIRDQFGERWMLIAGKARSIAESEIRRRTSPSDVFAPVDDDSYLLLFPQLDEEEARLKTIAIARAIQERLLGELGILETHTVETFVAPISGLPPIPPGYDNFLAKAGEFLTKTENISPQPRGSNADSEIQTKIGEVGVRWQPVWMASRQILAIYYAKAMRLDIENRMSVGNAAYVKQDSPCTFEIDRRVLNRALHHLRLLVENHQMVLIGVPIRLQSLLSHSGARLVDACRELSVDMRKYLMIEIADIANPVYLAHLGEGLSALQPFCRVTTVRVPPTFSQFDVLTRHRISIVSIDLEEHKELASSPQKFSATVIPMLRAARAKSLRLQIFGVAHPSVARIIQENGVDYLNGAAIAPEEIKPAAARPLSLTF